MKSQLLKFKNLNSFIQTLSKNENLVDILEYGNKSKKASSKTGNYSFALVYKDCVELPQKFYLWIEDSPVDCMIKFVDNFFISSPQDVYDFCHLNARVIYEQEDWGQKIISFITQYWKNNLDLGEEAIFEYRYKLSHWLNKIANKLQDTDHIYLQYIMDLAIDSCITFYSIVNNIQPGKPKQTLATMNIVDNEFYKDLFNYYQVDAFEERFIYLSRIIKKLLKPFNGIWKKDEVLIQKFGVSETEKEHQLLSLFGYENEYK